MNVHQQIKKAHEAFRAAQEKFDEMERLLKRPDLTKSERQALRAAWNRTLKGTVFDRDRKWPKKARPVSSSQVDLSNAQQLKDRARLFDAAGRDEDARHLRAKAELLDTRARRLRKAEEENLG